MRNCLNSLLTAVLMLAFALSLSAPLAAQDAAADNTEDVIVMNDLRELRGNIISETPSEIVFEYINRELNLRSRITLKKADIAKIERDVPIKGAAPAAETPADNKPTSTTSPTAKSSTDKKDAKPAATYGIRRADEASEYTKKIYVIPMEGQMGTDVNEDVYKDKILQDIRELNPDYIVLKMKCMDIEDRIVTRWGPEEQNPDGSQFLDMYRDIVGLFRDELRDIPQVMWVQDSVGISSVIAMAWPDMYMMPGGRLGGLEPAAMNFLRVQDDFNTLGKYREAYMAWLKGFAEYGGYDHLLINAMVRKEMLLSASWVGREVKWSQDDSGEYLVDISDEHTVSFRAKDAEDFGISDGTAETIDDLMLLLGVREYTVLDGVAEEEFTDHKEAWRRALAECEAQWQEHIRYLGWATGEDTVRYLGRAMGCLEKILAAIERYKAVEFRIAMEAGISKIYLITTIEQMKERLRAARNANRGAGAGGAGTGRGGGGPASR